MRFVRVSGVVGIIAALFGLSAVFAATLLCGPGCGTGSSASNKFASDGSYSWGSNALSDLGVSQVASLFNYSLVIVGILNAVFAIGFLMAHRKTWLFQLGSVLLIAGGGSLSLVGVFTEAAGSLHGYVSLGYFVLFPLAIVLIGVAFVRSGARTGGYISLFTGLLALVVILGGLAVSWQSLGLGFGVPEIIEAILIAAWIVWAGVGLARATPSPAGPPA